MTLNTCLFNYYPSNNTSLQIIPQHSFHHLIYSFIGPINDHQAGFEAKHPKLNQILGSILMVKRAQELDFHIIMMIDSLCGLKSSPLSNILYAKVSNLLLESNIQQNSVFSNGVQNLYAKKIFHSLITGERLNSSPAALPSADEKEEILVKKEEFVEDKDSDLNEAASTTSGFSREADICLWSLTSTDLDTSRPPHDASGNYLFPPAEDDLKGVLSCYDGFFVGNLEMDFDAADQYLSLPMKQIPGKNTPQKQAPKQIVVEKKTIHQIKAQENMFSSPVVQSKIRFDHNEISNPLTPQYIPPKNSRRSPKSNFQKTYASSTRQSVEKQPASQQQQRSGGGISMSLFVNDKLKKMDHGHAKKSHYFTDSQANSGIAKRS